MLKVYGKRSVGIGTIDSRPATRNMRGRLRLAASLNFKQGGHGSAGRDPLAV